MGDRLVVVIIDYDMGNVRSIQNAVNQIGDYEVILTADNDAILAADVIILPGVGAFPEAMKKLAEKDLISTLNHAVRIQKKPTLGVCLGMQLLFDSSEEKLFTKGLGWIPGEVVYIIPKPGLRVPHIGWNSLKLNSPDSIFNFLGGDKDFYFVHSLHAVCEERFVLAECDYGDSMIAAVQRDNVVGMQFHPEKSQKNGLASLSSFFRWAKVYVGHKDA